MSFFDKEEYTLADIQNLIDNQMEESIKLDFKQADSLGKTENKKKEISKDVSSFANTIGGIIVYGLVETNDVASKLSFIDGNQKAYSKEWLENIITSNIHPKIEGLKIFPIRKENDISQTIYVVKIPASENAPHMAQDKRFYKRHNFQAQPMEEYEVRNIYNKKAMTCLDIIKISFSEAESMPSPRGIEYRFLISPIIKNISQSIEDNYKTEIILHKRIRPRNVRDSQRETLLNREENDYKMFSFPSHESIFPDEEMKIEPLRIIINSDNSQDKSVFILKVNLYYSNGIKRKEFNLFEILSYKGKQLSEIPFI